jgi:hypothetical protein
MSALDDVFLFFKTSPGFMYATLTSIQQVPPVPPPLPGGIANAIGASVTYNSLPIPTIIFSVKFKYKTDGGPLPTVPVTLKQHPGSPPTYSMDIPAIPFNGPVTVDAVSDVTYCSQGTHFLTLALKHGPQG